MKIRYYVADKAGCIILPQNVMADVKINVGDLLYFFANDGVNTNISAIINEQGRIDYPILEPDEPYKLYYEFDNIIYCSRKFY